uniref:Tripartite motif containing 80 n=1 Tax=Myotis lucifugus TaxID=59463 RepID=G1QB31_MYOLU
PLAFPDMQRVSQPVQDHVPAAQPPAQPSRPPPGQRPLRNSGSLCKFEDQVLCPICLEVFHSPVTTACGHNFCMTCLQGFWDHQAAEGETLYCPCRESFSSRPRLCKNVTLEEMVTCFTQAKSPASASSWKLAGPRDVPCDFCGPQKRRALKSCLQCMASLCEKHLRSHSEDQVFRDHQLLEPWDFKSCLCRKHRKLRGLYCRTEGCCVCGTCLLEEHRNHDTIPLQEERARREVELRQVQANVENQMLMITSDSQKHREQVAFLLKMIQTMRDEVQSCFSGIIQEVKQLQTKVLDFVEKEEAAALEKLGSSIQQSHNWLLKLEADSIWLRTLLTNPSDQQLEEEFPRLKNFQDCMEPLMGTSWEEKQSFLQLPQTLAELRSRLVGMGLGFINQLLLQGIKMNSYEVLPPTVDRKTLLKCFCNLNFDPPGAKEGALPFKGDALRGGNLGGLPGGPFPAGGRLPGFKPGGPQGAGPPAALPKGRHYWERRRWSNLGGVPGRQLQRSPPPSGRPRGSVVYLLGRNPDSWCLEWDSLRFSVWHNNTQTVLQGGYHRTLGVALDCGAGCLSFYGVAGGVSLLYRFLASFLEPLYPAVMVSSGALVTLKQ